MINYNNKNLVLSAACGLDPKAIEFFLKSLRKYYDEDICFLIQKNDIKIKKLLKIFKCDFVVVDVHKFDIQLKRYEIYLNILNRTKYNKILLCDSRDIYFQSNPFDYSYKGLINFFLEDKIIRDCPYNSDWIIKTYGKKIYESIAGNIINCSGTTLGDNESIKEYLNLMISNSSKYKFKKKLKYFLTFRRDKAGRGVDQAHANYIVHKNLIKNSFNYKNESGPVATVYYLKNIIFNEKSELINLLKKPYAIVHQYDKRWEEFKDSVYKIKKNLNIS